MGLKYSDAGVNKEAGYREVQLIKDMVARTYTEGVLSELGGFAGVFQPNLTGLKEPVLVSGTDGVGTKLKFAFLTDIHNTVGQDCVAMCVNDILCQGARPLFFLDYIAAGELIPEKMAQIVQGVADGCVEAGCALVGGETAEMPGFYAEGEYDMAGFAVGMADRSKLLGSHRVQEGDVLIGLPSAGVHSNGFSLIRHILFEKKGLTEDMTPEGWDRSLFTTLLTPTRIYVKSVLPLVDDGLVQAAVHVTGGGFYENIPRAVPDGLCAALKTNGISVPSEFRLLQEWGGVSEEEMFGTFNMGIGMVLFVREEDEEEALTRLRAAGEEPVLMGRIEPGEEKVRL